MHETISRGDIITTGEYPGLWQIVKIRTNKFKTGEYELQPPISNLKMLGKNRAFKYKYPIKIRDVDIIKHWKLKR